MTSDQSTFASIPLEDIKPNPDQPRKDFDENALNNLADSIREHGVLLPVAVKGPYSEGSRKVYFLLDGERRWRASKIAGKEEIPAVIHHVASGQKANLELALIGNLQRADLNPLEEGTAYKKLRTDFRYTLEKIAQITGKSTATISTRIQLTEFEEPIQRYFANGGLSPVQQVISALNGLPPDIKIKVATRLGARKASITTVQYVCTRMTNGSFAKKPKIKDNDVAAVAISGEQESHIIRALGMSGRDVKWNQIIQATDKTCKACVLRDFASDGSCKDCPAVEMLKNLLKTTEDQNAKAS